MSSWWSSSSLLKESGKWEKFSNNHHHLENQTKISIFKNGEIWEETSRGVMLEEEDGWYKCYDTFWFHVVMIRDLLYYYFSFCHVEIEPLSHCVYERVGWGVEREIWMCAHTHSWFLPQLSGCINENHVEIISSY